MKKSILIVALAAMLIAASVVGVVFRPHKEKSDLGKSREKGFTCDSCAVPPHSKADTPKLPNIPQGTGRPCLVVFTDPDVADARAMVSAAEALSPKLKGIVDVVTVDTDVHLEAQGKWSLRIVPTVMLVDNKGKTLFRTEKKLAQADLLKQIEAALQKAK